MASNFDIASTGYDVTFTHSNIGILQRSYVLDHLEKMLSSASIKNILEINCGTGEDAVWLAKKGYNVLATDLSEKMIEVASKKSDLKNLKFEQADINHLTEQYKGKKFDLIFSDFGGLNCLNEHEFESFFEKTPELLSEKGMIIMIIMPRKCIWERFYFILKRDFKNAFRRSKKDPSMANVEGEITPTWYYNPKDVINLSKQAFSPEIIKPIGFFIPPSYLEPFFSRKKKILSFLNIMENKTKHFTFLSAYSDHFLITLKLK